MLTLEVLKILALSFPETTEDAHFEKIAFKVKNKIFATFDALHNRLCVKLSEIDQDVFERTNNKIIYAFDNKWGKKGWTNIEMAKVNEDVFIDVLTSAYCEVAPKKLADQIRNKDNN